MKNVFVSIAAAAFCFLSGQAGHATVLYDNPIAGDIGNCLFNTTCAGSFQLGSTYAAQLFSLSDAATIRSASFTDLDCCGVTPAIANWIFLAADGAGGLPGTILASGASPILQQQVLGTDGSYSFDQFSFNVADLPLNPGSYYFAIQAVTNNFNNYLSQGAAGSGAAETSDGGTTWSFGYESFPSVAVALYDTPVAAPEPGSLLLLVGGLAGITVARRRRA